MADTKEESIDEFCRLEKLHAERQKYVAFSESFLKKQFKAFRDGGEVLIYTARKDNEVLAQNFMIFYGPEASYHYGVSSMLGTIGFLVTLFTSATFPHTQTGNSLGQVQGLSLRSNSLFTILSSSE